MREKDNLADVLWAVVMWVCVVFFAFAAGIMVAEHKEPEKQPEPMSIVVGAPTAMKTEPVVVETASVPDVCEDTYLRDDLPIDYETQMHLYGACLEFGIDYELALAVIEQETGFRNVTGDGGDSQGYMQIQRKWWKDLMDEIGAQDLNEPKDNFRTGCAILRQLLDRYGNVEDALTAYNSGKPGSSSYSRSVMERMQKYGT